MAIPPVPLLSVWGGLLSCPHATVAMANSAGRTKLSFLIVHLGVPRRCGVDVARRGMQRACQGKLGQKNLVLERSRRVETGVPCRLDSPAASVPVREGHELVDVRLQRDLDPAIPRAPVGRIVCPDWIELSVA